MEMAYASSYRKYMRPLFPTFATVNCLPSLPAELPSGAMSYFTSSASLFARRFTLFALRKPCCICLFLISSGEVVPVAFRGGAGEGESEIPIPGDPSASPTDVDT